MARAVCRLCQGMHPHVFCFPYQAETEKLLASVLEQYGQATKAATLRKSAERRHAELVEAPSAEVANANNRLCQVRQQILGPVPTSMHVLAKLMLCNQC